MSVSGVFRREQWLASHVAVSPLGGGNDDWTRIFGPGGVAVRAAAQGKTLVFNPGTWICNSGQSPTVGFNLPRYLRWWLAPGCVIQSQLASTGGAGHQNSPINYDGVTAPLGTTNPTGTIAQGAISFTTVGLMGAANAAALVGAEILIEEQAVNQLNQQQAFEVIDAVAAGGGATITLDRPTVRAFSAASSVMRVSLARGISIWGNGCVVEGTGDRCISLVAARDCYLEDFDLRGPGFDSEYTCSFDTGSFRSSRRRIRVRSSPATALAIEAAENVWCYDGVVETLDAGSARTNAGALFQASYACGYHNLHVSGRTGASGAGILVGWILDTVASRDCKIVNCRLARNLLGIDVRGGSNDIEIIGTTITDSTSHGIQVLAEAAPTRSPGRVHLTSTKIQRSAGVGILANGAKGITIDKSCRIEENTLGGVATQNEGEIRCHGTDFYQSVDGTAAAKCNSAGDYLQLIGCKLGGGSAGFGYGIWVAAGKCDARANRWVYDANGSMTCIVQTGGELFVDDAENIGQAVALGLNAVAGTVKLGPSALFPGTTTPITTTGATYTPDRPAFAFAASTSLVTAAAQTIYPGGQAAVLVATDALGYVVAAKLVIGLLRVTHTGAAGNVAGQTVAYDLKVNGATKATVTLATTAGAQTGQAQFTAGALVLQPGDLVRLVATPSAVLTTAVTDIQAAAA